VLVQTRQPDHPVLDAAVRGDPGRVVEAELALRRELQLPPAVALAELSGDAGVVGAVVAGLGERPGVEVLGPADGRWLVRAPDHPALCDALAAVGRPPGAGNRALRVDVDPVDV
jgi:primosomal protein N' (replication factor Y)